MGQGKLTAQTTRALAKTLQDSEYEVLFDHGDRAIDPPDQLGQIASWSGCDYTADSRLACLDLALVHRRTNNALLLVEIEESAAPPKVLLGDVMTTLLGDHVTFQGKRELNVGPWTRLIVLVRSEVDKRSPQISYLVEKLRELKPRLTTSNASINKIIIDTFSDAVELEQKLLTYVDELLVF